jgi:hypothetical protein
MTSGTVTTPTKLPPIVMLQPIEVQVDIPQMACLALSPESGPNNDRDEIYILFSGIAPNNELQGGRLPRYVANDSYYEYWVGKVNRHDSDWTNHDQAPVGRPILWTGTLGVGESADFLVTIMEQDNSSIGVLKDLLKIGLDTADALAGSNATAKAIITTARQLATYLPESKGHDFIGAFSMRVTNAAGKLETTFVAIHGQMQTDPPSIAGDQTALFDCMGKQGSSHYRVVPAARIGPQLPFRTYLGKETDQCGDALLAVEGGPRAYKGFYHVGKGQTAWVPLASPRFAWYCGMDKEWATAPDSTNLVQVHRSATDREITWYCYSEGVDGFRPDYAPTQTWVKISNEFDQCGEHLLAVEGIGGFYHLTLGQQKWVPISRRQFDWYGDIDLEHAVAPEETNLLRVTRDPHTRQITWECCREIVSLRPYTTPDDTKVLIDRKTDQCSADRLTVFGDGGFYYLAKGEERWVPISKLKVYWLCGINLESSAMPAGTNLLHVKRNPMSREISWRCYRSTAHTYAYRQPDNIEAYLGSRTDQCGEPTLQVGGVDGKVMVVKGQVGVEVYVASSKINWWCGGSDTHVGTLEHTDAPELTNFIKVTRAALSREMTIECYYRPAHHQIDKLAALLWTPNDKAYFFKRGSYARYERNPAQEGVEPGYPKPIAGAWPGVAERLPNGIDSAVVWPNGRAYFFSGDSYVAYALDPEGAIDGYPQYIAQGWPGWPESWADGIDAALVWDANTAYFFKGTEYLRYNIPDDHVDPGYPRLIAGAWPGLAEAFPEGIDSAIDWGNGYMYFFWDGSYVRYRKDPTQEGVEAGYPKPINESWPGLNQLG